MFCFPSFFWLTQNRCSFNSCSSQNRKPLSLFWQVSAVADRHSRYVSGSADRGALPLVATSPRPPGCTDPAWAQLVGALHGLAPAWWGLLPCSAPVPDSSVTGHKHSPQPAYEIWHFNPQPSETGSTKPSVRQRAGTARCRTGSGVSFLRVFPRQICKYWKIRPHSWTTGTAVAQGTRKAYGLSYSYILLPGLFSKKNGGGVRNACFSASTVF